MPQNAPSKSLLLFLVVVAVFGFALVPLLLLQPSLQITVLPFRRPLISALYSVVCVLGIIAVFYPVKCRMVFQKPIVPSDSSNAAGSAVQISGHHPDCKGFSANRITIRGRVFCAACSGLLVGAVVALAVMFPFSLSFIGSGLGGHGILAFGAFLMFGGLAQIRTSGYVKMAVNTFFVIGSCISLVAADLAAQSLIIDFYVLALIVYMLWLRILLSEWHNKKACLDCGRCL